MPRSKAFELRPDEIRDIRPRALGADGRLLVLPAAYWATTTRDERALFGYRQGLYSFPTVELVEHLVAEIGDHTAIEIGAGHGVLAEALGILATDNRMQEKSPWRERHIIARQPPVQYGPSVIDCPANQAVRKYRPDVVVACWVTQRYDPAKPDAGGHDIGVDEEDILRHCKKYIFVGNEEVHCDKPIWKKPHRIEYADFLYSRAHNQARDFIAYWDGAKK